MGLSGLGAADGEYGFYRWIEQAFSQDTLSYHSGCTEENYLHLQPTFRFDPLKVSRRDLRFQIPYI